MSAYCIVYETVEDPTAFERYRTEVPPTIEAHGGRFLVRGGEFAALEGELTFDRIVVIEFPTRSAAMGWYNSPEYQQILPIRLGAARSQFIVVDGVATMS
ncbi:MAG: hypothetical protein QOD72_2851 [Acidimicrobiaceae bacterium]|jgi:uncharacterized protein (DUF1330 family)|nr:hypothetical protein [Acidimicrobiaceae bacterium]